MNKNLFRIIIIVVSFMFISTLGFAADKRAPVKSGLEKQIDKKADAKTALVDINTATKAELDALPGIGAVYSQKIINGRPYASKDQLKSKKIIPDATYERIKDHIIAKQALKKR
jgi:competence protein ComEA